MVVILVHNFSLLFLQQALHIGQGLLIYLIIYYSIIYFVYLKVETARRRAQNPERKVLAEYRQTAQTPWINAAKSFL